MKKTAYRVTLRDGTVKFYSSAEEIYHYYNCYAELKCIHIVWGWDLIPVVKAHVFSTCYRKLRYSPAYH